jgi:lysophospholipase L1-like esterase
VVGGLELGNTHIVDAGAAPRARRQLRLRGRGWRFWLIAGYAAALHAALLFLVFKTDFLHRVERQFEDTPFAAQEFDVLSRRWATAFARSDARAKPGAIVFLGDSIMRELDTSSIARHTLNLAIPGETTARLLDRMERYRSIKTARGIVLGVGVNDLHWRPLPEAVANYAKILDLVPDGAPVLMMAVLPVDERVQRHFRNADIGELNRRLSQLCAEHKNCRFIDPTPSMRDETGNLRPSAHDGDGIHLSSLGHDLYWNVMNAAVLAYLPPALPTPPAQ